MNSRLAEECQRSFYKELYHMDRPGYSVVTDETTGKIYVKKELRIYDRKVYEYLKEHRCPYIPAVYEVWENDGTLTVIEEYIQGDTLSLLLEKRALSDDRKKEILLQVCDALSFLHGAEPPIIHRDVKADNIMVTENGTAYLIDYNAAKFYRNNQSRDTILLGTEGSAAPEQYGFRQSDARTDIYGLGILIQEMFTDDDSMQKIAEKATRMEPDQRYQTVRDMKRAIERRQEHRYKINIPGFRTGHLWKMIIAIMGYLLILYCGLSLQVEHPKSIADTWLNRIIFLLMSGCLVDLYTGWTPIFRKFPLMQSERTSLRIAGYILSSLIIIAFGFMVLILLENFM